MTEIFFHGQDIKQSRKRLRPQLLLIPIGTLVKVLLPSNIAGLGQSF